MCKYGDIIVIDKYKTEDGFDMSRHSFIVVNDREGIIKGFSYDIIASQFCMSAPCFKR